MAGGLVALLDDVATLAKLAASSVDDVSAAAGRATTKAAGVVIDDTAVTPRYVGGLSPDRELPIIGKIALGSLRNKLLILLPAALFLSALAPWAIVPILMVGGAYLSFEGAEKLWEKLTGGHADKPVTAVSDPGELEARQVSGAIRTDLILSGEIMAIALGELPGQTLLTQALALLVVAVLVTAGVYGAVAVLVKMDDVGHALARRGGAAFQAIGRGLVVTMPVLLRWLATIGIAAMLWVGGGIVLHGLEELVWTAPAHAVHHAAEAAGLAVPVLGGAVAWLVGALGAGLVGLVIGGLIVALLHLRSSH